MPPIAQQAGGHRPPTAAGSPTMMITPEMMEQLGGKRGAPRGPDMTHREIVAGDQSELDDAFAGAETLDDAVGDWNDGRSKSRRKKAGSKRRKPRRDKAFDEFVAANDRLDAMVANLRNYVAGLRLFCDCHAALTDSLVDGLGHFDGVAEQVSEYQTASQSWCRTSKVPHVDSSLHSKVEVALELAVIDPIVAHVEVRRSLQAQLAAATGDEREVLLEEVKLFSQSMTGVMKGPMRALRRGQLDLLGTAAAVARGDEHEPNSENRQRDEVPPPADQVGEAAEPVEQPLEAEQPAALNIWRAESAGGPWPAVAVPAAAAPSYSQPRLTVLGQLGWEDGQRVLHVSLHNGASVALSDISLTLLPCERAGIAVTTVPLQLASLRPREEATTVARLGFAEDADSMPPPPRSPRAASKEDEEFDSFFTERLDGSAAFTPRPDARAAGVERQDSGSETRRSAASWALDAEACGAQTIRFALQCRELSSTSTIAVQLPYHLLLHGDYRMSYGEFEQHWNSHDSVDGDAGRVSRPDKAVAGSGYASSLARRRAYSGTTRVCVRVEGVAPLVGWARIEEETLLSDVRASLMSNPAFQAKLPADWVFVKKNAPVGKKAEGKWMMQNLGHEIVLRGKGPRLPASLPSDVADAALSDAAAEVESTSAVGVPHAPVPRRSFVVSTSLAVDELVQALARGGITLAGRVEQRKDGIDGTEGLLRFGARAGDPDLAGEHVVFLLQMERLVHLEEPEPEPEPEMEPEPQPVAVSVVPSESEWGCTIQASRAELEPAFESCVRSLAAGAPSLLEHVEILGGGTAYFGDWGGVTLDGAQEGVGNDDGFVYSEYGGTTQEQMLVDFLESNREQGAALADVAGAFEAACIDKSEWMQELVDMRKDGELNAFLESVEAQSKAQKQAQQQEVEQTTGDEGGAASHDYGDYGGVSLEDALAGDSDGDGGYDYGDYGGVSLEEVAAFTSSDDDGGDDDDGTDAYRLQPVQGTPPRVDSEQAFGRSSSMDREAAAMVARMETTNSEVASEITEDMLRLMLSNPKATLADWAVRSEWARDTGGVRDEDGSPLRAQGGAWQQLWSHATQRAAETRAATRQGDASAASGVDSAPAPAAAGGSSVESADGSALSSLPTLQTEDAAAHRSGSSSSDVIAAGSSDSGTAVEEEGRNGGHAQSSRSRRGSTATSNGGGSSTRSRSSARSSMNSSSAAWLAERQMDALTRGTSLGSKVRIAVRSRPLQYATSCCVHHSHLIVCCFRFLLTVSTHSVVCTCTTFTHHIDMCRS
eukprot:COSAG06_NODE_1940_length_8023_cov_11.932988_9_plen_1278_part_00